VVVQGGMIGAQQGYMNCKLGFGRLVGSEVLVVWQSSNRRCLGGGSAFYNQCSEQYGIPKLKGADLLPTKLLCTISANAL